MEANESIALAPAEVQPGFLAWVANLVHQHRARLLAYARRRGLGADDALDAVQDSFLSFFRLPEARAAAHVPEDAIKLLSVILRHNVQNHRRKHARRARAQVLLEAESPTMETTTSSDLIAWAEELGRLRGCIVKMGQLQRGVVTLSLLDEHSHEVVARSLGINEGYVRVLLHRARAHLRTCAED